MDNVIEKQKWEFIINKQDSPLIASFKICMLGYDYVEFNENTIANDDFDLTHSNNVASLAYLILADYKTDLDLLDFLIKGLGYISKRPLYERNSNLLHNKIALLSIVVIIKKLELNEYYDWIKDVLAKSISLSDATKSGNAYLALNEYFHNNKSELVSNIQDEYVLTYTWLSYINENEIISLEYHKQIYQKIWKSGMPYFNDEYLDCLACSVIDKLISEKFVYGIYSVEKRFNNAIEMCNSAAKKRALAITAIIVLVFTIAVLIYGKLAYEYLSTYQNHILYHTISTVVTAAAYIFTLIKVPKKIYHFFFYRIKKIVIRRRGLYEDNSGINTN